MTVKREERVFLNPEEVATSDRIERNLHSGNIRVGEEGIDWGQQEIDAFMVQLAIGAIPIDSQLPNRVITIPLSLGLSGDFDEARIALQAEVGRINEEGGTLKRMLLGGTYGEAGSHLFADTVKATLKLGGGTLQASDGIDPNAELILEALPDFYGDEIEEPAFEGTGNASGTFQIKGNLPGRTNLTVTEKSGQDQLGLGWHFRCRNYDLAETADWVYEAEAFMPLDAAAETELSGASGGKTVLHNNLSPSWTPILSTNLRSGSFLTHVGLYDVWARVYTTSAVPPWLRLLWDVGDFVAASENMQVQIPAANAFYLVNLGQVNIQQAPIGEQRWQGIVQAYGASGGENVHIDRLYMFCADESSGIPSTTPSFQDPIQGYKVRDEFNQSEANLNGLSLSASGIVSGPKTPGTVEDKTGVGTVAWTNPGNAKASDNAYATAALEDHIVSHYLLVKNFGFAIPAGATVTGITVSVEKHSSGSKKAEDNSVKIVKAGAVAGTEHALGGQWSVSDLASVYGSTTDLWGTTWTVEQINAEGFGVAISAKGFSPSTASIDAITITVYYTEAGTIAWATSGDAVDLKVIAASHAIKREEVSDANINTGRYAIAGNTTYTDIIAGIKCKREASAAGAGEEVRQGAIIRYINESNWLMGCVDWVNTSGSGEDTLRILKRKAGTVTELLKLPITASTLWRTIYIEANTHGRILIWAQLEESGSPELLGIIFDTDLAEGGTLASGKVGFYDAKTGANKPNVRWYDNFAAWVPSHDAVSFSNRNASLTSQGIYRQSEDGLASGPVAYPGSDLPRIPVSGAESRPVEIGLKPSRGDFGNVPDSGLDKISAQLSYRPCWSGVPES